MPSIAVTEKKRLANIRRGLARTAFGIFLSALATIISDPYWYTIRGDCELGLCLMSMLTPEEYAALLLTGGFVTVVKKKNNDGTDGLGVKSLSVWKDFFEDVGIGDVAEDSIVKVKVDAFKHRKAGTKIGEERMRLHVIRVGRYNKGETVDASHQLTDGINPPPSSAKLRSAQRTLHRRIKDIIYPILHSKEDEVRQQLEAVVEWVRLKELEEDVEDYAPPANKASNRGARVSTDGRASMDIDTHKDAPTKNSSSDNTPSNKTHESSTCSIGTTQPPAKMYAMPPPAAALTPSPAKMPVPVDVTYNTPFKLPEPPPKQKVPAHLEIIVNCPTPKTKCYPDNHPYATKYPTMNSCGIDLMDRTDSSDGLRSQQNFQGLLREMKDFSLENKEELQYESWTGRVKHKVVHIPLSNDTGDYLKKARDYKWIQETLDWSLRNGTAADSIACMLQYFKLHYPTEFKEKLIDLGVSPKQMNEYEMAATMSEAKIGIGSWRKIVQCFTTFTRMDRVQFAMSESAWRKLGEDHGTITGNKYIYKSEEGKRDEIIQWWSMDPAAELELRLTDFANRDDDFDPTQIEYVHSIYSGDHGKGKLRFCSKLVIGLKDSETKATVVYPLGDVKCRKDKSVIFKNTIKDSLAEGINRVEHGKIEFVKDEDSNKWNCRLINPDHANYNTISDNILDVTAFMVGDLKFLSMMLGKENFEGDWCHICRLQSTQWQDVEYDRDDLWTLDGLKEQADNVNSNSLNGTARHGVREDPYFDIPPERYIWPILHTLMGVGNNILNHLTDTVDNEIQNLPARQRRTKRELEDAVLRTKELQEERDYFDSDNEGSGREIRKAYENRRNEVRKLMDDLEDIDTLSDEQDTAYVALDIELNELDPKIKALNEERNKMTMDVQKSKAVERRLREKLDGYRLARKTDDTSIYSKIDEILTKYDIKRAAYHGGQLTGVCVKQLMSKADEIMNEVATLLIDEKQHNDECIMTDDAINTLCDNMATLLIRWDGALACLHTVNPTEEDCTQAQNFIDQAMELTREMGYSVTPKYHGAEAHIVNQMRDTVGGLYEFDEQWMEQYHQTGYTFDMKYRNQRSEIRKAKVIAANNRRVGHHFTKKAIEQLNSEHTKGKRKSTEEKMSEENTMKKEKRLNALD